VTPAFESVLKQYKLYVEEGTVDYELLEISSEHLDFKNSPSLLHDKYVYGCGPEFEKVCSFFFSSQSLLGYIKKAKREYKSFFELASKEPIKKEDFYEYQRPELNWLVERGYIKENEEGLLEIVDARVVRILIDLNQKGVACFHHYPEEGQHSISLLRDKGVVKVESTLFSSPEQAYLNYYLNRSKFSNGPNLRNSYSHVQPSAGKNQAIHESNYMIFLRLFIMTIIKINDEFCLRSKLEEMQKDE
jgi:hypothetical protein